MPKASGKPKNLTGTKALFRHKTIMRSCRLTAEGWAIVQAGMRRTKLSFGDYIEHLAREHEGQPKVV